MTRSSSRSAPKSAEAGPVDDAERLRVEAAQRDPRAFAALYEAHFERVYAYVVRRVRDRHEAEDLTADVFHQALANIGGFEWRGAPFSAWLYRIAANAIVDRAKQASRARTVPAHDVPEAVTEDVEERARLFRLVDRLPADQRRVVFLRFAEQKPIRDIAVAIGRSEGAVKQLQFRGLQTLRTLLGERHA